MYTARPGHGVAARTAAFAALAALIAACARPTTPGTVQPGAPGQPARVATAAAPGTAAPRHVAAEAHFMQAMLAHHAQALEMTRLVPTHTKNENIALLARRIDVSQLDEMEMMRGWLRKRNEPVTMSMSHDASSGAHHASMPGMLTPEQLKQLAASRDAEFDRLFLTFMIQHHEGALVMVKDLLAIDGAAQEPEIFQFVSHVDADQRVEIARMRLLLQ